MISALELPHTFEIDLTVSSSYLVVRFELIIRQIYIFSRYQHENIVTLYGFALDGPHPCLVYQFLENGSLEDRLARKVST